MLLAAVVARRGIYAALSEKKLARKSEIAADLFAYAIDIMRAIESLKGEMLAGVVQAVDVLAPYENAGEIARRKTEIYKKRLAAFQPHTDRSQKELSRARIFLGEQVERDLWILVNFFDRAAGALMQIEQYYQLIDVRRQIDPTADIVDLGDGVVLNSEKVAYCWKLLLLDVHDEAHVRRTVDPAFEKLEEVFARFVRDPY